MRHSLWASVLFCGVALAQVQKNAAPPRSNEDRLNDALYAFDFVKAKAILTTIMAGGGEKPFGAADTMAAIDRCIAAGTTSVSPAEAKAIAADPHAAKNFSPDDTVTAAMALANGWGVPKDRKRATALVCHSQELTISERESMTELLADNSGKDLLFCDHITSGIHGGGCESFAQDKLRVERDRKIAKLTATYTEGQKTAFTALQKAAKSFFDAHASDEQDMSGTGRSAFYAEEVGAVEKAFFDELNRFEKGKLPPADNFADADAKLNALYRKVMKETDWSDQGSVTADGVRGVQRRWIKYRDAWAVFGPLRYPGTTADQWKAWATRQRVKQLEAGFAPFGAENR